MGFKWILNPRDHWGYDEVELKFAAEKSTRPRGKVLGGSGSPQWPPVSARRTHPDYDDGINPRRAWSETGTIKCAALFQADGAQR